MRLPLALLMLLGLVSAQAYADSIRIFAEPNYQGWNKVILSARASLGQDGSGYRVRSLRVRSGGWLLCSDTSYNGDCIWASQDLSDLDAIHFDHRVMSAKPGVTSVSRYHWGGRSPPYQSLVLFPEHGYEGKWFAVSKDFQRPANTPLRARSIVVQGGIWQLCSDPDYSGRCLTVTGDIWDLSEIFFGPILSVRRLK